MGSDDDVEEEDKCSLLLLRLHQRKHDLDGGGHCGPLSRGHVEVG